LTFQPGETDRTILVETLGDETPEVNEAFAVQLSNASPGVTIEGESGRVTILGYTRYTNDERIPIRDAKNQVVSSFTSSTIEVSDPGILYDVNVGIDITHTYVGQLGIELIAPDGSVVALATYKGGDGDNFTQTVFDDAASTPIYSGSAPFTGTFQPQMPLAALEGIDIAGTWTLQIRDVTKGETGTLNSWSLEIAAYHPEPSPPVAIDDTPTTSEGTPVDVMVLSNDTDADNDPLTVASVTQPTNGSVVNQGTYVTYTPNAGYTGSDSFTYVASDGTFDSNTATVTVTVNPPAPSQFSITDVAKRESRTGKFPTFTFTVTRSGDTSAATTISYATAGVSATAGEDYYAVSGYLFFDVGETTKTITVTVIGDGDPEDDEIFELRLIDEFFNELAVGTGTIINDDR
jgi:subtilisin-like proprotein convertase family protein